MTVELHTLLGWGVTLVSVAGAFFHLRTRVTVLETRQEDDRKRNDAGFDRIEAHLDRIEDLLHRKQDRQ